MIKICKRKDGYVVETNCSTREQYDEEVLNIVMNYFEDRCTDIPRFLGQLFCNLNFELDFTESVTSEEIYYLLTVILAFLNIEHKGTRKEYETSSSDIFTALLQTIENGKKILGLIKSEVLV